MYLFLTKFSDFNIFVSIMNPILFQCVFAEIIIGFFDFFLDVLGDASTNSNNDSTKPKLIIV